MTMIVTGGSGRLGRHIVEEFPGSLAPSRSELDITDREAVMEYFASLVPEVVFHSAGWVDVRGCEGDHSKAWAVNVKGTENVVEATLKSNPRCYFVYPSTACVFDGDRGGYTEDDTPHPKNMYGLTKILAEKVVERVPEHLIIRTDFVDRAKWRYEGAFSDRFSTCVFADTLAVAIRDVIRKKVTGVIHLTGKRKISHYDLARLTTPDVKPISLASVDLPLPRDQSLKSVKGWDMLEL